MPDRECDVFISYRRHDWEQVDQLAQALQTAGLSVWLDRNEIENAASIQQRIDQGLAQARVLLAWYSAAYPHSRPCQWELTAALIAATAETGPVRRVLVVNPEPDVRHIQPIQLRDLHHFNCTADFPQLAERIREAIQPVTGTLGALRRLSKPRWHGLHGLGSNRFTGRETDLWAIHSALTGGNFAIVAGLQGPGASADLAQVRGSGGIGKSLLAEEYGLRFGAAWPGGVFWINGYGTGGQEDPPDQLSARHEAAYASQLGAFALQLGLDVRDQSDQQLRIAIGRTLTEPTLWIVDDLPACTRQELEPWLAPSPLARTLITTRSRRMDSLGAPIDLGMLDPEAARSLLTLDHPLRPEEEAAVADILQMLNGYVLALDVARTACRRLGYQNFCRRLQQPDADALDLAAQLARDLPNGHNPSIAATLLSALRHLNEFGLDVLRLAAHLAQAPIPQDLLAACLAKTDGLDQATAEERAALGLQQALDHSLAEETAMAEAFTVHSLVTRTVKRHDATADRQNALRTAALAVVNQGMEASVDIRQHVGLLPLLPHAQLLAADSQDLTSLNLAGNLGRFEFEAGRYREAHFWYKHGYQGRVALLGVEHPDTLTSMNNLALTLRHQGYLPSARVLHEKELEVCTRVLGEEHPDTLTSMNNLATTLWKQGNLPGARALQEKVLEARTRVLDEQHPDTLSSMNNLAETLRQQGDLPGARELHEKVLEIRTCVLGVHHPNTLTSMNNLAESLRSQGQLQDALALQEKVLEVRARVLGVHHPDTSASAWNLFRTLDQQGEQHHAAQALRRPHLLWLLECDPVTLSADQQQIRRHLTQALQPPNKEQTKD